MIQSFVPVGFLYIYQYHYRQDFGCHYLPAIFITEFCGNFDLFLIFKCSKSLHFDFAFVCVGVVDSEDIPLNLSRELLQNSPLIRFVLLSIVNVLKLHTVCYIDLVSSVVF